MSPTRKDQIKRTAAHMFRKRGYQATSMRDIAKELGIEAPSLYNHITSKQELLSELLLTVANTFMAGMERVRASDLSDLERLEHLVKLHVDITIDHSDEVSLLTSEWIHLEKESGMDFIMKRDAYEKDFRDILTSCIRSGFLEAVDIELAMFSILSTLRWLYSWCAKHPEVDKDQLAQQMVKLLIPRKQ